MIDVDNRNPHFHSEGGMFFDDDIDTLIIGIGNGHVVLPDGISSVGDSAFADMDGLTSLLVPSNIKKISSRAFYCCANLKSIEFYEGVDEIGENSFVGVNIQSLELPDTLSTLSSGAFADCENLSSVTTGDGITTIMLSSFANCGSLKTIVIGRNISQIGLDTFNGCTSLTSIIFLGKTTAQVKSELTNYN